MNFEFSKMYSSDYLNFKLVESNCRSALEFKVISEFNKVRGKEFIPFSSFNPVYLDAKPVTF